MTSPCIWRVHSFLCALTLNLTLTAIWLAWILVPSFGVDLRIKITADSMQRPESILRSESCRCGRTFTLTSAYTKHVGKCQVTKKRLSGALDQAKSKWMPRKRRRLSPIGECSIAVSAGRLFIPNRGLNTSLMAFRTSTLYLLKIINYRQG